MTCTKCGAQLAAGARFCSSCGTPAPEQSGGVSTGGGAYVGGSVQAGGDFVGRDQTIQGGYTRTTQQGLQGDDLAKLASLFQAVYAQVDAHASQHADADPDLLKDTAKKIEQEASKGDEADPDQIKRWLGTLMKLAPDVAEVAVNALTNPGAAVASGVRVVAGLITTSR